MTEPTGYQGGAAALHRLLFSIRHPGSSIWRTFSLLFLAWLVLLPTASAENQEAQERAIALAVDGRYEEALKIFRELLYESPEDPLLNYYAGTACVRLDRIGEGMSYLERAVRYKARFPQAYLELGEAYLKKKLKREALKVASTGLERFPKNQPLQDLVRRIEEGDR
jgi:tetratricopeptide (TPR) repeat protein